MAIQIPFIIAFYTNIYAYIENIIYFKRADEYTLKMFVLLVQFVEKIVYENVEKEVSSKKQQQHYESHNASMES